MAVWNVVDNGTYSGLECRFTPCCHYCYELDGHKVEMQNTCIKLLNFPLNEPAYFEHGIMNGYAIDVEVECPICGYWEVFGVAVDKEHWQQVDKRTKEVEVA